MRTFIAAASIAAVAGLASTSAAAGAASAPAKPTAIVLGDTNLHGKGWGTSAPKTISGGTGLISHIRWQHWGASSAVGWGLTSISRPTGGHYPGLVRVQLRASDIAWDQTDGGRAYMRLEAREPRAPGSALGAWFSWIAQQEMCN